MKRTPLNRKTPLRSRSQLKRKTRLRSRSKKRQRDAGQRRVMVRDELARRELCEAGARIYQYRVETHGKVDADRLNERYARCNGLAVELHEPLTRARGGSILDPSNTVAVCRACHDWIHDNPTSATKVGLLKSAPIGGSFRFF